MIPAGRVEERPGEGLEAGDSGNRGLGEASAGEHEHVGDDDVVAVRRAPPGAVDAPHPVGGIPVGRIASPRAAAADRASSSASTMRSRYDADLVARAHTCPTTPGSGARRSRRGGGHVARDARVGVVAPGSADGGRPLEHDEVVAARPAQRDGHAEPGEPGPDDRDLDAASSAPPAVGAAPGSRWCADGTAGTGARRCARHPPPAVRARARCRPRAARGRRAACRPGRRRRTAAGSAAASRPTRVHGIWMCGMLPLSMRRETATIARCSSIAAAAGDERHAAGGTGERDRHELGEPARLVLDGAQPAQVRDALFGGLDVPVEDHASSSGSPAR